VSEVREDDDHDDTDRQNDKGNLKKIHRKFTENSQKIHRKFTKRNQEQIHKKSQENSDNSQKIDEKK